MVKVVFAQLESTKTHLLKRKCVQYVILLAQLVQSKPITALLVKEIDIQQYYQIIQFINYVYAQMDFLRMANLQTVLNVTLNAQAVLVQVPIV